MHECPHCGQACACDGEDVWNDAAAYGCEHECAEYDDDEGAQEGIEEGMDAGPRIIFPDFKPCPFCGCAYVREYVDDGFYCEQCGYGYIWHGLETEQQQDEIRKRWNTRPIEDALRAENERLRHEGDEYRQRAAQWQQLCDLLGLAHATHPHYVADELKEMRDALAYIAQSASARWNGPLFPAMEERSLWLAMGKRALKAVNWSSREADLGTEGDPPFCGYCHTRHYGYQDHYGA